MIPAYCTFTILWWICGWNPPLGFFQCFPQLCLSQNTLVIEITRPSQNMDVTIKNSSIQAYVNCGEMHPLYGRSKCGSCVHWFCYSHMLGRRPEWEIPCGVLSAAARVQTNLTTAGGQKRKAPEHTFVVLHTTCGNGSHQDWILHNRQIVWASLIQIHVIDVL